MLDDFMSKLKGLATSWWGLVIGSALAGEYFRPGAKISNFLDDLRGR